MTYIVICSRRDDGDWRDLQMAVASFHTYTPLQICVAMQGPGSDNFGGDCERGVHVCEQPEKLKTFGAAYGWVLDRLPGPWILANDDVVCTPDTVSLLLEDVESAEKAGHKVGFMAARANYARPAQRAVGPGSKIVGPVKAVSPICAYLSEEANKGIEWPDCNWYSDDVVCADMRRNGFDHFISRAYIHHIGERSTGAFKTGADLQREGVAWVQSHRPDLLGEI